MTAVSIPKAPQSSSLRSAALTRAALSAAACAVRRLRSGSSIASATATSSGRTATTSVPERPKTSTAGVIRIGPSANPALPPTEKKLMPVPRREPDA